MPQIVGADRVRSASSIVPPALVPQELLALTDDECLARLARAVQAPDERQLDEVARLIGRLVATIE